MNKGRVKVRTKGEILLKIVSMNGGTISQERLKEVLVELGKKSNITPFRIVPTKKDYWLLGLRKKMRELEFMDYVRKEKGIYRIEHPVNLTLPSKEEDKIQECLEFEE